MSTVTKPIALDETLVRVAVALEDMASAQEVTLSAPTTLTLVDNVEYYLTDVASLTITYPSETHWESLILLTTASSGTVTITLPTSRYIGSAPTFGNSETWELSIRDGIVVAGKVVSAS